MVISPRFWESIDRKWSWVFSPSHREHDCRGVETMARAWGPGDRSLSA